MSTPTHIIDGRGTNSRARVSSIGQVTTGNYGFDETKFNLLDVVDTAYNFYAPKVGKQFVISGIIARANKLVSAVADATVIVYEATSTTTTTVSKVLLQLQMTETNIFTITSVNILVNEGKWVNAKTDDDDITMNILGYYIPKL